MEGNSSSLGMELVGMGVFAALTHTHTYDNASRTCWILRTGLPQHHDSHDFRFLHDSHDFVLSLFYCSYRLTSTEPHRSTWLLSAIASDGIISICCRSRVVQYLLAKPNINLPFNRLDCTPHSTQYLRNYTAIHPSNFLTDWRDQQIQRHEKTSIYGKGA